MLRILGTGDPAPDASLELEGVSAVGGGEGKREGWATDEADPIPLGAAVLSKIPLTKSCLSILWHCLSSGLE